MRRVTREARWVAGAANHPLPPQGQAGPCIQGRHSLPFWLCDPVVRRPGPARGLMLTSIQVVRAPQSGRAGRWVLLGWHLLIPL